MKKYVQFGAGLCGPDGWESFDVSPTLWLQRLPVFGGLFNTFGPRFPANIRYGDIVAGLPLRVESCHAIYCSHVLEHLSLNDFRKALVNTHSYLVPQGHFRFVLPDLEQLAKDYLADSSSDAALHFMRQSFLGQEVRRRGIAGLLRASFCNSNHLWMWDFKAISVELLNAGFDSIRRAEIGDGGDAMFDAVEDPDRWMSCLAVDCIKR